MTPALSNRFETAIGFPAEEATLRGDLDMLLWSASIASLLGVILIPSFQRFVTAAVAHFEKRASMARLALFFFSPAGFAAMR